MESSRIKSRKFIRRTFGLGYIWGIIMYLIGSGEYRINNEELSFGSIPLIILMIPTFYYFFIQSRSLEILPGFIGLYLKRKRIEEQKKLDELDELEGTEQK